MRRIEPLTTLFGALALLLTSTAARAETKPLDALPLAADLHRAMGMDKAPTEELAGGAGRIASRLLLDDGQLAIDTPEDIQSLAGLVAALEALEARNHSDRSVRLVRAYAAYMVHAVGHAYATDPRLAAYVDALPERAEDERTAHVMLALVKSVKAMRELGRRWFPEALQAALADDPSESTLHVLRGHWLLREGRTGDAVKAFEAAMQKDRSVTVAVQLYRAQIEAGQTADAKQLAAKIEARAPGMTGVLAQIAEERADELETRAFEASRTKAEPTEGAAQIRRYVRLGRVAAADALAKRMHEAHPDSSEVLHAVAEFWAGQRRYERLQRLCEAAEAAGRLDRRLLEARIAAAAQARMEGMQGATIPEGVSFPLDADLERYAAMGEREDRVVRSLRLYSTVMRGMTARGDDADAVLARARADAERQARLALEAHPTDLLMLKVVVGAKLALKSPADMLRFLRGRLDAVAPADRSSVELLLARLEIGYGVRRKDVALLRQGVTRAMALNVGAAEAPVHEYTVRIGELALAAVEGKADAFEKLSEAHLGPLADLVDRFDPTAAEGHKLALGTNVSVGALALASKRAELGAAALRRARQVGGRSVLGLLGAGVASATWRDWAGAQAALSEALGKADRPAMRFALHKWLALAANSLGSVGQARQHMKAMLDGWAKAGVPEKLPAAMAWPVFVGDYQVDIGLEPGEPLEPRVEATPVVVLLPSFAHARPEIRKLLDKLK